GADALMIMTEWPEFRTPDFDRMAEKMNNKAIFDGRNLYDLNRIEEFGFDYFSIGRKAVRQLTEKN
ncbi:MAG: UDP binding domain-containing protein, partial [Spirosomataceae bacterium]